MQHIFTEVFFYKLGLKKISKSTYLWAVVPWLALAPRGVGGTQAVAQRVGAAAAELRGVGLTGR